MILVGCAFSGLHKQIADGAETCLWVRWVWRVQAWLYGHSMSEIAPILESKN
jgi:hypothetical protein